MDEFCHALSCSKETLRSVNTFDKTYHYGVSPIEITTETSVAWNKFFVTIGYLCIVERLHHGSGNLSCEIMARLVESLPFVTTSLD